MNIGPFNFINSKFQNAIISNARFRSDIIISGDEMDGYYMQINEMEGDNGLIFAEFDGESAYLFAINHPELEILEFEMDLKTETAKIIYKWK